MQNSLQRSCFFYYANISNMASVMSFMYLVDLNKIWLNLLFMMVRM